MKEQELFESDSVVFQEKEAEEKKKKRRRKRYAKRKRKDSETGRSQEHHDSQPLENEAERLQSLQTSEENPSCERLKEDVRKEFAIEINAQLSAENLQKKEKEFSVKSFTNENVLEDLQDDEIGKVEDLRKKKLEAEQELSDENVQDNLNENHVEKQNVEQSVKTDDFNFEANLPDGKNYFSDARTDTTLTEDVFHSVAASEEEGNSTFSNKENFSEIQKAEKIEMLQIRKNQKQAITDIKTEENIIKILIVMFQEKTQMTGKVKIRISQRKILGDLQIERSIFRES